MPVKFLIPGERETVPPRAARGASAGGVPAQPVTNLLEAVEVVDAFNLSVPARDRAAAPLEFNANDDDIVEIEVEGGFTLWTSAARYSADLALLKPEAVAPDGSIVIDKLPRASVAERGVKEWFQSALRVLRLKDDGFGDVPSEVSKWPADFLKDFGLGTATKATAWLASKLVMWKIESQLKPGPGLYAWEVATAKRAKDAPKPTTATFEGFPSEKAILVFIHGTASSTLGSFGEFLSDEAQPHWRVLRDFFGEHIYAFEHRTMSESPIDNALQLVSALPPKANVYLVSHSRGGLIGDLVCLKEVQAQQISRFRRKDSDLADADEHDRRKLKELAHEIAEKQLRIERFVRCASPARGTLLASENIDTFLSVLTNLVGLIPGIGGTPLYEVVKRVTLQIVKNRTEPELVPGIEAMMPTSPLVAFLNAADEQAGGALGVVAGDIEGGNWLKRLGVFLTDHFIYESRDNDLVVNTDSMFHGARRSQAYYVFDQGGDVSHFNYFKNKRTRAALLAWIAAKPGETPAGFNPITEGEVEPVPISRSMQTRAGASQPIVFVLPGIMGSHLKVGDSRVWLNYPALLADGLGDLSDIDAKSIQPASLIGDYYRKFCEYLANSHEVIPFAYDWRKSVRESAKHLAEDIENALDRSTQPVRIVAHCMGGVVVRAMITQRPDLWDRICDRDGGRFVMLGTPNRGSHTIVEALLGTATTIQQLALLDMTHSAREVARIIAGFPGVLELLPSDDIFFKIATWAGYSKLCKTGVTPDSKRLADANSSMNALAIDTPLKHVERVLYVAGSSDRTISRIVDIVDGRVVLEATTEGDGRVTYQSGRLPGVAMWYMDAEHGDLANHEPAFPAIVDLLDRGTTAQLGSAPPNAARGGEATYRTFPEPVLYPTATSLTAGLLGQRHPKLYAKRPRAGFRVSVVHGDLRFSHYPIVVGHYEGDTIVGAEAQIDRMLDGALSDRYNLGLYPGTFGSLAVVLRQTTLFQKKFGLPNGAVVMGLGKWGELTGSQLANLIRRAALQYLLQLNDAERGEADLSGRGLSILLIGGTSAANISTEDSVAGILRGIAQANREIDVNNKTVPQINEIEIVELYADSAIEATHAALRLANPLSQELNVSIDAQPLLQRGKNGRNRLLTRGGRDSWRRWEISVVRPPVAAQRSLLAKPLAEKLKRAIVDTATSDRADAELLAALADLALGESLARPEPHRELRFLTLSDRARAEVIAQQRQPELIERLISDSVSRTAFRETEARALFELMIPNDLKDGLSQLSRVVLVVDEETAEYPWELMHDGVEPLCSRIGMVRQLQTARFRAHIRATTTKAAYIVGDPLVSLPYKQLPGAREEAKAVAAMLEGPFMVTHRDEKLSALEVLGGLFERPYRILHLAGHGQFESPKTPGGKARSGMVLDNGVFLTAVEIGQMQQVPELVFLNCCHIGKTGPETPAPSSAVEFNRLAASVSRELIEMGVRAVVAAGWAVRDDAALHFAKVFYSEMLNNETFGRALQSARRNTFTKPEFRDCNTWGAYQAYGDPDFQFDPGKVRGRRPTSAHELVSPAEFIDELTGISRSAQYAETQSKDPERAHKANLDRLENLLKGCPGEWLAQSDVLMALGLTYGEFAQFEQAIHYLRSALETGELDNATTLKAVEQLANFEGRYGAKQGSIEQLYAAIYRLQGLNEFNETAERLSLIGSAYKRITQLATELAEVREALDQSASYYRLAHERNVARGLFDPYPALNWLTASALLDQPVPEVEALLSHCDIAASERYARAHDTFDAVACIDLEIVRALFSGSLSAEAASIADRYQETFARTGASPREIDSVLNQLRWMDQTLEKLTQDKTSKGKDAVRHALAVIQSRLAANDRASSSGQTDNAVRGTGKGGSTETPKGRPGGKKRVRKSTSGGSDKSSSGRKGLDG